MLARRNGSHPARKKALPARPAELRGGCPQATPRLHPCDRPGVLARALLIFLSIAACRAGVVPAQQAATAPAEQDVAFSAAGIGTGTRPIGGLWQFHLGDNPAWAEPGFDDRGWERLPADQPWGDVGHPGVWGYAWYRREIALDPKSKQPLALLLPPLDSTAEVYWNGVKVGSEGSMPPHPEWFYIPHPVAINLPPTPGASSGVLALRIWAQYRDNTDVPDASGLQGPVLLGDRKLVLKMPQAWTEHYTQGRVISNIMNLLYLLTAAVALVLWVRSRGQWLLLFVCLLFGGYAVNLSLGYTFVSIPFAAPEMIGPWIVAVTQQASLSLILAIADLPPLPGIRGSRFWLRVCVVIGCGNVLTMGLSVWRDWVFLLNTTDPGQHIFAAARLLDPVSSYQTELYNFGFPLLELALLGVCLVLSRRTLPRVLFMVAVALDTTLQLLGFATRDASSFLAWLRPILLRPVLVLGGSKLTLFTSTRMLVLVAVVYAVWDQLSQQLARQRFVNAELQSAQEVQQVLVPPTAERDAPGYAVSSVYRPASEVGGDFFQIISLEGNGTGDGTLIVAGDVSGKGLRAAMTVSLVVGALRTLAEYDPEPAAVLAGLNRRLIGRTQGGFVTCCAVRIDAAGHAAIANAGHCHPYLDGHEIVLPVGLPLGIVENAEYAEVAVEISHGQQLTLLSDGVVEARNGQGEIYGFDRLDRLMGERPTAEHVADTAVGFGQDDDITVLTVTRLVTG